MAVSSKCQTPNVVFHTEISSEEVSVSVTLPIPLNLSEEQAEILEANLHNVLELVLAPYFQK